jgi:lipoteichoic acid synthase
MVRRSRAERGHLALTPLAWCVLSLLATQYYVLQQTQFDIRWSRLLVTAAIPGVVGLILLLLPNGRRALWLAWIVVVAAGIVAEADLIYFRYFGNLISAPALLGVGQVGAVLPSALDNVRLSDAWMVANAFLALVVIADASRWPAAAVMGLGRRVRLGVAVCLAGIAAAGAVLSWVSPPIRLDQRFSHLAIAQEYGLFAYHAIDLYEYIDLTLWRPPVEPNVEAQVVKWFRDTRAARAASGPLAGALAGRSVIVIVVESLQAFAAELDVDGQPVMPNLRRLRKEGLWFNRVLDQSADGRTSDTELMLATSLLPLDDGAAAFRYPTNQFVTLPGALKRAGYETVFAVPFAPAFWNRATTYRSFGFANALFQDHFTPGPRVGWGLNDRDFLAQMAARFATMPRPFYATLITLSLHHPYESLPSEFKLGQLGRHEATPLGNYLHAMRFFDAALGSFVDELERSGVLNQTLLVVLGDHDAGFPWSRELSDLIVGGNPVTWLLHDRVPLLMLAPGSGLQPREVDTLAGQIDVPPTIAALLGVDSSLLPFVGRNLLVAPLASPVPMANGQWASESHVRVEAGRETGCYDIPTRRRVSEDVCAAEASAVAATRAVSRTVLTHDLQQRVAADLLNAASRPWKTHGIP